MIPQRGVESGYVWDAMEIQFTTYIFKEGRTLAAHALELDVASCGGTREKAVEPQRGSAFVPGRG